MKNQNTLFEDSSRPKFFGSDFGGYRSSRTTDPITSRQAGESISPVHLRKTQKAIIDVLRSYGPMCDEQIEEVLKVRGHYTSPSGVRGRRAELVHAGLIIDSGKTTATKAGRNTIIWELRK